MRRVLMNILMVTAILGLLASGISCTKTVYMMMTPTATPLATPTPIPTPTPTPSIQIPQGMGAIIGKVSWGGIPLANSEVEASTKNPGEVYGSGKNFSANTDTNGDYMMFVEPGLYWVGCTMPGSEYLTYSTRGDILLANANLVRSGEIVTVTLQAVDWSVRLISPGATSSSNPLTASNYPTLVWQDYDWSKYGSVGYYMVTMGIWGNGELLSQRTDNTQLATQESLDNGKYWWNVEVYAPNGEQIAGSIGNFYFQISQ